MNAKLLNLIRLVFSGAKIAAVQLVAPQPEYFVFSDNDDEPIFWSDANEGPLPVSVPVMTVDEILSSKPR